jgi:hypothetical protein
VNSAESVPQLREILHEFFVEHPSPVSA